MSENAQPELININGWPFRLRRSSNLNANTPVMLLLHGHRGNENVMWVLTKPLPDSYVMLAPRAPVQTGEDQYSWHEISPQWPSLAKYHGLADELLERVDQWLENNNINKTKLDVMGFSQGATMAYALALTHPKRVEKIAALAGMIPESWKDQLDRDALENKPVFIAHGTKDEIIPIEKSRKAAEWLKEKGARVTFCEADTGHKLSANCFSGLGKFFQD